MKVLVVVDMQNDFIDGSLGTDEAKAIVDKVEKRVADALAAEDTIVLFTRDTHQQNYLQTQEGKILPVEHCIKGTLGWEIVEPLMQYVDSGRVAVLDKPNFGSIKLPETLHTMLTAEIGATFSDFDVWEEPKKSKKLEEIELCGLCTDVCVISNALILKAAFPDIPVKVQEELCAGVTPQTHKNALEAMKMCQVEVIDIDSKETI